MSKSETIPDVDNGNLPEDLDVNEDDERLKGDAIGDTLFSETWLLKTLMKLTQVITRFSHTTQVMLYIGISLGIPKVLKKA